VVQADFKAAADAAVRLANARRRLLAALAGVGAQRGAAAEAPDAGDLPADRPGHVVDGVAG